MDAIAGDANPMRKLILTHPDLFQELLLENLARMGITKLRHVHIHRFCCV
jgi:hypothetical protein